MSAQMPEGFSIPMRLIFHERHFISAAVVGSLCAGPLLGLRSRRGLRRVVGWVNLHPRATYGFVCERDSVRVGQSTCDIRIGWNKPPALRFRNKQFHRVSQQRARFPFPVAHSTHDNTIFVYRETSLPLKDLGAVARHEASVRLRAVPRESVSGSRSFPGSHGNGVVPGFGVCLIIGRTS